MKCINIAPNFFKKIILFLLISLSVSNVSAYSHILSPINIEDTSMDDNCEKNNVDKEKKIVYLTFDDGPSKNTELILDILKENNVHATFFIISPYIEPHIEFIKRAYEEGNAIGNHTADHEFKYVYTCEESFFKSFNKQQDFIKEVTGNECTIFRFPGGSHNTIVKIGRASCRERV